MLVSYEKKNSTDHSKGSTVLNLVCSLKNISRHHNLAALLAVQHENVRDLIIDQENWRQNQEKYLFLIHSISIAFVLFFIEKKFLPIHDSNKKVLAPSL